MKLNNLIFSALAAGICLSSCNLESNDAENYQSGAFTCANFVSPSDGDAFAASANYTILYYYLSGSAILTTTNLNLGYGTLGFTSSPMEAVTKLYDVNGQTLDVTSFTGGVAQDNGVSVSNLKGYTSSIVNILGNNDPDMPGFRFIGKTPLVAQYIVNHDYTVKTFMPDAIYTGTTSIMTQGSEGAPFTSTTIRYRVVFNEDFKKANVIFYDAKFAENMPVTLNFVLKDLDVTFNKNGYVISGKDLIPLIPEGGDYTDYGQAYVFSSFEFSNTSDDLTTGNAVYNVQIGRSNYIGSFQGYYVRGGNQN